MTHKQIPNYREVSTRNEGLRRLLRIFCGKAENDLMQIELAVDVAREAAILPEEIREIEESCINAISNYKNGNTIKIKYYRELLSIMIKKIEDTDIYKNNIIKYCNKIKDKINKTKKEKELNELKKDIEILENWDEFWDNITYVCNELKKKSQKNIIISEPEKYVDERLANKYYCYFYKTSLEKDIDAGIAKSILGKEYLYNEGILTINKDLTTEFILDIIYPEKIIKKYYKGDIICKSIDSESYANIRLERVRNSEKEPPDINSIQFKLYHYSNTNDKYDIFPAICSAISAGDGKRDAVGHGMLLSKNKLNEETIYSLLPLVRFGNKELFYIKHHDLKNIIDIDNKGNIDFLKRIDNDKIYTINISDIKLLPDDIREEAISKIRNKSINSYESIGFNQDLCNLIRNVAKIKVPEMAKKREKLLNKEFV